MFGIAGYTPQWQGGLTKIRGTHATRLRSLAAKTAVCRAWLIELKAGKPTVELGRVLAVLDALSIVMALRTDERQATTSELDLDSVLEQHRQRNDEDA